VVITRIRGYALPSGEYADLYADGDRWATDPVPGATLVGEGWLVPGLVDAHTHPGAAEPGQPMDPELLREQLHQGGPGPAGRPGGGGAARPVRAAPRVSTARACHNRPPGFVTGVTNADRGGA
jgi:hypothetical protein